MAPNFSCGTSGAARRSSSCTAARTSTTRISCPISIAEDARRLKLDFTREDILRGHAIEDQLAKGLYWAVRYTILPELEKLRVPTLVIHGELDFFPLESSRHIAEAIPGARLVVIPDSGHFSYIDAPDEVRAAIASI